MLKFLSAGDIGILSAYMKQIINMESYSLQLLFTVKYTECKKCEDKHYRDELTKVSCDEMDGELDTVLRNHCF